MRFDEHNQRAVPMGDRSGEDAWLSSYKSRHVGEVAGFATIARNMREQSQLAERAARPLESKSTSAVSPSRVGVWAVYTLDGRACDAVRVEYVSSSTVLAIEGVDHEGRAISFKVEPAPGGQRFRFAGGESFCLSSLRILWDGATAGSVFVEKEG